jgi:trans-aconitate methyltransferase
MAGNLTECRVCGAPLGPPDLEHPAPALTSIKTILNLKTLVWICGDCGHAQCPDLPDLQEFYDTQYRISLDIDNYDQLYQSHAGEPIFRTDYQSELVLSLDIPERANVLDFGAGKATTLQKVVAQRPDIVPFIFDVSMDYLEHWSSWVRNDQIATYELPEKWLNSFDLITAHFVLEHVADPVGTLTSLQQCLSPQGRLFFTVPDAEKNSGDLLVVDHLSHFTKKSLSVALMRAGLTPVNVDSDSFSGAFAITAMRRTPRSPAPESDHISLKESLTEWSDTLVWLSEADLKAPIAIYGAGFYGSLAASRRRDVLCFLDRNPRLIGQTHMGIPVLSPEACPVNVCSVLVALNPARAREIIGDNPTWSPAGASLIFFGE